MNKFVSLLTVIALALFILPVSGVAIPGCPESSPTATCIISVPTVIPASLDGSVFQYKRFTINPGIVLHAKATSGIYGHGSNITIIAKQLSIGGFLTADGDSSDGSWNVNGGNGGLITLIAKNQLLIGFDAVVSVNGGNGIRSGCSAGNGGNAGKISLRPVAGSTVSLYGALNATAGLGAIVPSTCNTTNGTTGANGVVENVAFVPSIVSFGFATNLGAIGQSYLTGSGYNSTILLNAIDEFGDAITPAATEWTNSNTTVIQVTSSNATQLNITGLQKGTSTIKAKVGSVEKSFVVSVAPGAFNRISIDMPTKLNLSYNENSLFAIRAFDFGGNEVPIPADQRSQVTFEFLEIDNQSEAQLISCLVGNAPCETTSPYKIAVRSTNEPGQISLRINHSQSSLSQVINFIVTMPTESVIAVFIEPLNATVQANLPTQFTLFGEDGSGYIQEFSAISWVVENKTGTGRIDANGTFVGITPGIVKVTGVLFNRNSKGASSATVNVELGEANKIKVTGPSTVTAGQSATFTATLQDGQGNNLTSYNGEAPRYAWSSTSGTVYQNGTIIITEAGDAIVTATLAQNTAVQGTQTLSVNPAAVYGLIVGENGAAIEAGSTGALTAILVDKFTNEITPTDATWTILNGTGQATLNGRLLTGTKTGYVTVYATANLYPQLSATGTVTITSGLPISIKISPATASIRPGNTITFTVDAYDVYGNKYTMQNANVTWNASNTGIATVSTIGVLTAYSQGTTLVSASIAGTNVSDSITIQVLELLGSQSQQLAAPLVGSLPVTTVPGAIQQAGINVQQSLSSASGGLTGLFTMGELTDPTWLLIFGLTILLVGAIAYYYNARKR
ncbi:MAG: hypothetical protein V1722_04015 [Candidatus Micrarchaeota archaeon]